MMRFKELLTGKTEESAMVSDSLAELREMTNYLIELEGEKQAALNDLELERLQLRSLFDSINEPIHVSHPATHEVLYANKVAQEIYGSDIVGKSCYEVFHDQDDVCSFCPDEHILGENVGQTYIWEYNNRKHGLWYRCIDRAIYWPDGNGGQLVRFQLAVNITEQKQAEAALKQYSEHLEEMVEQRTKELQNAQEKIVHQKKLEVLGQLADGVGHDLLNPLGAIKNVAYFLNIVLESDPEVREMLEILEKEVVRSEKIINSLLDFAQPRLGIQRKVNINDILLKTLSRVTMPKDVGVELQLEETLSDIIVDPDQIGQVFENIILNSIEAMPDGGQLTVRSRMKSTEWEAISFTDTGLGISADGLDKLFEPLFTTKARGCGLGLTIAKALVDGHGGIIEAQTKLEKGSTFTVSIPVSKER